MSKIPSQIKNPKGLHARYIVSKVSGEPVDPRAEYFVLRVDRHGGDHKHVNACRRAILAYATEIEHWLPELARDIYQRYNRSVLPPNERLLTHKQSKKLKTDRSKKTSRRRFLVTVWSHPDFAQTLVQPGTKKDTRRAARETILGDCGGSARKLVGVEEYWSNEEISNLSEYEG